MAMYTKDKLYRITLRLNERQFNFVQDTSSKMGVSPAEFLRIMLNLTVSEAEKKGMVVGRENDKTNQHDIV